MNRTITAAALIVLALSPLLAARGQLLEIRVTGEHQIVPGDPPAVGEGLAALDAHRKVARAVVPRIEQMEPIKSLGLKPGVLDAYVFALVGTDELIAVASAGGVYRVDRSVALEADHLARRVVDLHRDQDVAYEVVDAWKQSERVSRQLDDRARRQDSVTELTIKSMTAQGYAAAVRTVPVTVGGRESTPDARARARRLAERALALLADSPDAHWLLGTLAMEEDNVAAAEAAYRRGLQRNPDSSAAHTKLAAAIRLQDRFPEALTELREAMRIDPTYAPAHSDLGMILKAENKVPEAIAAYREAIRLDPDWVDAHNGLAVALAGSGKLEEAVKEFREIVRIDPDSTIGHYNLAYALADLDRDAEAAAALREVIRIHPNHYNARYNLGEMFRLEQKYDEAAVQFREYLRLAPDTPQNRRNITRARRLVQQFEDPNAPPMPSPPMRPQ